MKIILVGGERITYYLARSFINKGFKVVVIHKNRVFCEELSKSLKALIINGDGSKREVLEQAEPLKNDIVVALTPRDQDNFIICQQAKNIFSVERTLALVNDPENLQIFKELGIKNAISTTDLIASIIEQRLSVEEIINLIPVEEGKINITEIILGNNSPVIGKKLRDAGLPKGAIIGSIIRGNEIIIPYGDTMLKEGDKLLLISLLEVQSKALELLNPQ
ncbi:MAG: trk/ktr system potassium uptake protein [Thermotogaceae bacterium]|nr:trk/ktr system potassium uptake protein [Thermotogaceae bacterium]